MSRSLPPHEIEQIRRSVAMLRPGEPALDCETALAVLYQLQAVSARVVRVERGLEGLLIEDSD